MIGLERPGEFVGHLRDLVARLLAVECRVQVDPLGAARHGHRVEPHPREDHAGQSGDLGALGETGAGAGIEIEDHPIRVLADARPAELPLGHVEFEGGDLTEPHEGREVVQERVRVDVVGVLDVTAQHPLRRRPLVQVLLEEHVARRVGGPHSVDPALARDGAVGGVPDERLGHSGVVIEHVRLGRARLRVEDFAEARELEAVPVDGDDLVVACRCGSHPSIMRQRAARRQRSAGTGTGPLEGVYWRYMFTTSTWGRESR